jgi:putative NADPH-quinone reductase
LKEWQDLVLEYGFAYGADGTALKDKLFFCALTAGAKEDAYQSQGYNHFTIRELLTPLEQTALLTGMRYLPPLTLFGARTAIEDGRMPRHLNHWQRLLKALVDNRVDLSRVAKLDKMNDALDTIIRGEGG